MQADLRRLLSPFSRGGVLVAALLAVLSFAATAGADGGTPPFPTMESGFTQDLFGVGGGPLCGVGFGPDGSAWAVSDRSTELNHFGPDTVTINGTVLHAHSTTQQPVYCGLTSAGDASGTKLYANADGGVSELDGTTGAHIRTFATNHAGNGYGIAVDPQTGNVVYAAGDGTIYTAPPGGDAAVFSDAIPNTIGGAFIDGIGFDGTGNYLFLANFSGDSVIIMRHDGTIVRQLTSFPGTPDGIAVHGGTSRFLLVNDNDGRIYRLDFPGNDFENDPGTPTIFADDRGTDGGPFRGDMAAVSPIDHCFYVTQQGGARYLDGTVETGVNSLVRICDQSGFESGGATVTSIDASCAGNTLTATANAYGAPSSTFTLTLQKSDDGSTFAGTDQTATIGLTDATSYSHDFDVSSFTTAKSYKVVSDGGTESNVVDASTCTPGSTIPEAPAALLLPLSLLGLLGVAAGALYIRRRPGNAQTRSGRRG